MLVFFNEKRIKIKYMSFDAPVFFSIKRVCLYSALLY